MYFMRVEYYQLGICYWDLVDVAQDKKEKLKRGKYQTQI